MVKKSGKKRGREQGARPAKKLGGEGGGNEAPPRSRPRFLKRGKGGNQPKSIGKETVERGWRSNWEREHANKTFSDKGGVRGPR